MRTLHCAALILAATLAGSDLGSQTARPVVEATRRHVIDSKVLSESRIVDVTLPVGYAADSMARYPVVVVLDGEYEGEVAAAITRFYGNTGMLPKVLTVAVHNKARTRDLTPPTIPPFQPPEENVGGADRFITYLADEVLPLVRKTYRAAPLTVLVGHSLGGLFALHVLAKRPELFTGYVIMEPAIWWNDQEPYRAAKAALAKPAARRARVMLVNALSLTQDTTSWGGDRPMVREIGVSGETHESMAAIGLAIGLRRMFEDFRPASWRPGTRPIAMLARVDSLRERIGYEVPIPEATFATVARMSVDGRFFDDAAVVLDRMERTLGKSRTSQDLRAQLNEDRNSPAPQHLIPLTISPQRPTVAQTQRFIGHWRAIDAPEPHDVEIRASGDTLLIHDRILFPGGPPFDSDEVVIGFTNAGVLEWSLPLFNGLPATIALMATLTDDHTLVVRREARGWVPRGPFDSKLVVHFKRISR